MVKIVSKPKYVMRLDVDTYLRINKYKNSSTILSLYFFYQHQAVKQQSPKIRATVGFCCIYLKWEPDKIRWIKNILIREKLIHEVSTKQSEDGHSYVVLNEMVEKDNRQWIV